jgi:thiol-disulfide isomerase/thioredoxin
VPGSGRVETINVMKLAKKDDGLLDLLPGATLSAEGQFQAEGQGVRFSVAGKTVRLSPRPPLLGLRQATDLKAYSYLYVKGAEEYAPDTAVVAQLKRQAQPVRVRVFFGSWCPHCQRVVPGVVRLAEELASSRIEFEFYGVPQGFKGEPEAEKANVHAVPTGIVYVAGKEVGRIQSDSWSNPERALYGVLNGGGSSGR